MSALLARVAALGLLVAALGGGVELGHLAWHGRWGSALVGGAVAAALAWFLAWPVALLGHGHALVRGRWHGRIGRAVLALVTVGVLLLLAAWIVEPAGRRFASIYWLISTGFGVAGAALLSLASQPSAAMRWLGTTAGVATALGADALFARHQYGELHSLLYLVVVLACVPAASAPGRRLSTGAAPFVFTLLATLGAFVGLASVDRLFPWWRFDALHHGRIVSASTRIVQKATDLDGDGFSGLAWGGDCDDSDARVFPTAPDPPGGGDSNCNGVDLDGSSHGDLIMAPPLGSPALPPSAAPRRVMVFVVDALRADHFTPEHMPRMHALAQRGLQLRRCYAGGAETTRSTPLMHRPTSGAPSILGALRRAGVRVIDGGSARLEPLPSEDVDAKFLDPGVWAIRTIALEVAAREAGDFLLWSHLMAVHDHRDNTLAMQVPAEPVRVPASYKRAVRETDTVLGELWDALAGRGLADDLTWILVADHGEAFGEAGLWAHGAGAADAVLRVPCSLWGPGLPALVVDGLSSQRGLPATLAGLYGLATEAAGAERVGRSWLRWIGDPGATLQKLVVVRSARGTSGRVTEGHLLVFVDDRYRFVSAPEEGSFELFDIADGELAQDLSARLPDVVAGYRAMAAAISDEDGYPVRVASPRLLKLLHDM